MLGFIFVTLKLLHFLKYHETVSHPKLYVEYGCPNLFLTVLALFHLPRERVSNPPATPAKNESVFKSKFQNKEIILLSEPNSQLVLVVIVEFWARPLRQHLEPSLKTKEYWFVSLQPVTTCKSSVLLYTFAVSRWNNCFRTHYSARCSLWAL